MKHVGVVLALAALGGSIGCSPDAPQPESAAAPAGVEASPEARAPADAPALSNGVAAEERPALDVSGYGPSLVPDADLLRACEAGLKAKGVKPEELQIMLGFPQGFCPYMGVTADRIRAIAEIWEEAGCRQYSKEIVLQALNSGACGGDAG